MTIKEFYEWAVEHGVENYPLWNVGCERDIEIYWEEFVYLKNDYAPSNGYVPQ